MATLLFTIAVGFPDFPRSDSACAVVLQLLLVLEGVHARPEPIIGITDQLFLFHQSPKRLPHEFLLHSDVIENLPVKDEESSVDPNRAAIDGVNPRHQVSVALLQ